MPRKFSSLGLMTSFVIVGTALPGRAGEVPVETQAPYVSRDDEHANAVGRTTLDWDHEHERQLTDLPQVARGLVRPLLGVRVTRIEQELLADDPIACLCVNDVRNVGDGIVLVEHVENDDVDALDELALRRDRGGAARAEALRRFFERRCLENTQTFGLGIRSRAERERETQHGDESRNAAGTPEPHGASLSRLCRKSDARRVW